MEQHTVAPPQLCACITVLASTSPEFFFRTGVSIHWHVHPHYIALLPDPCHPRFPPQQQCMRTAAAAMLCHVESVRRHNQERATPQRKGGVIISHRWLPAKTCAPPNQRQRVRKPPPAAGPGAAAATAAAATPQQLNSRRL